MVKYCQKDVKLLEDVYKKLAPHITPRTHYGVIFGQDRGSCPECGSDELRITRNLISATGLKKIQYRCATCGKYHTKTDR